ncbi:HAD hydrolase-like protein [Actinosynnema sp. NPDC020468]|uniref:HAD family hydrolase n=1 Tax=Actinosynnema sp. NPDC020468 TaxID=3154488 RepID=UPI0033E3FD28
MGVREELAERDHVVVALDGPVASGLAVVPVAERLRVLVAEGGLPRSVARTDDPFVVLAHAASIGPATEQAVYAQWRRVEHEVVATARATTGVRDAFAALTAAGVRITVVGALDAAVLQSFLVLHGLEPHVHRIAGRAGRDRATLPPAPDLITSVLHAGAAPVESCAFVGGTKPDLTAARAAGVTTYRHVPPGPDSPPTTWFDALAR